MTSQTQKSECHHCGSTAGIFDVELVGEPICKACFDAMRREADDDGWEDGEEDDAAFAAAENRAARRRFDR